MSGSNNENVAAGATNKCERNKTSFQFHTVKNENLFVFFCWFLLYSVPSFDRRRRHLCCCTSNKLRYFFGSGMAPCAFSIKHNGAIDLSIFYDSNGISDNALFIYSRTSLNMALFVSIARALFVPLKRADGIAYWYVNRMVDWQRTLCWAK